MPNVAILILLLLSVVMVAVLQQKRVEIRRLKKLNSELERQLAAALEKISEYEAASVSSDGLLDKVIRGLVGMGVPGIVLLVAMSISGFAGAAAFTTALATLGGPAGMIGGAGMLVFLGLVSRSLAKWGLPKILGPVIRGLAAKGTTPVEIDSKIRSYPTWLLSRDAKQRILAAVAESGRVTNQLKA